MQFLNKRFFTKISGFKGERFSNLEKWQSLDKFKYLNIVRYFAMYADEHVGNCYFFLNLLQRKPFS